MKIDRLNFLFLNVGHFLDHLFMLIFARCSWCNRPGRLEVHHILPLAERGDGYDKANLQVLCRVCHMKKGGQQMPKHVSDRRDRGRFVNELR